MAASHTYRQANRNRTQAEWEQLLDPDTPAEVSAKPNGHDQSQATGPDPAVRPAAQRRRFSAGYQRRILDEADRCTGPGEVGALLRREGLHSSHLTRWRAERHQVRLGGRSRPSQNGG
jgi:hypothetical protein